MNNSKVRHFTTILAAILVIGLILRIIVILWIPTVPTEDFWSYFQRAAHLTDFSSYDATIGWHEASYPPGYSLLLSLFFGLPFNRLLIAKLVNVFLSCTVILLVSGISSLLFDQETALVAAAITALSPRLILQNTLIASENLLIPLLLLWIFLGMCCMQDLRIIKALLIGGLLGVLSLIRSVVFLISIPWFLSFLPLVKKNLGKLAIFIVILLFGQVLVMLPWAVRNYVVLGKGTFFTTTGGIDLFIGNNSNASGEWYVWTPDLISKYPDFLQKSVVVQDQLAQHTAIKWMEENPIAALKLYFIKWGLIFKNDEFVPDMAIFSKQLSPPYPPSDVLIGNHPLKNYQATLNNLFNDHYWILLILEILGVLFSLFKLIKDKNSIFFSRWLLMVLTALYFPTITAVYLASTRFHWPVTDLLIPFSALPLVLAYKKIKSPFHQRKVVPS